MIIEDSFLYLLADRELYEPLSRYPVNEGDFAEEVRRLLPPRWELQRRSIWFDCNAPGTALPAQGWKIHLSATLGNALPILTTTARILVRDDVPFKFVADRTLLLLVNSKRWHRGGAGKFITVYPRGEDECARLLEKLSAAMVGYSGPYILSDRRYRDSRIVHYRYGGFAPRKRIEADGRPVSVLQAATGDFIDDERNAYFTLPDGIVDPFEIPAPEPESEPSTLKNGRYLIQSVLAFSNPGGVYLALDRESGHRVIVKEARPFTNVSPRGTDAVWLLKKEHRLLEMLADTDVAPKPVDFFQDWEHFYLVEERIPGVVLRSHHTKMSLSLIPRPTREQAEEFYRRFRALYLEIAAALEILHERRIVFSDLSHYNVMVLDGGAGIRLIDFEGAYERGVDPPPHLFTPGFAPNQMLAEGAALPEDDRYALGSLMLAALLPINSLLGLDPGAHERFLDAMASDLALPPRISRTICCLLDQERTRRPSLPEVIAVLKEEEAASEPRIDGLDSDDQELAELCSRTLALIDSYAAFDREDRLYPADPAVFDTNPLSVAHGACGVAYVAHRINGRIDEAVLDWILRQPIRPEYYPPGLYLGFSGVAWTLLELGQLERAQQVLEMADDHHLLWRCPDLFHGVAGWGMTRLRFFLATSDQKHLDAACEAGDFLVRTRVEEDGACWWPYRNGISCSLGHGAAGISLFLLYLHRATGRESLIPTARAGLELVRRRALRGVVAEGGVSWRIREGEPTYTPYLRWGSAGIGLVLLRWLRVLDDPDLASLLSDLLADTDRKYAIFPGHFFGLAGIGEFHLDRAAIAEGTEREAALLAARRALAGCLLFGLERRGGLAFPGESRTRLSCDFATGGAGVAHFVHRLRTGAGPAFLVDELLPPPTPPPQPPAR